MSCTSDARWSLSNVQAWLAKPFPEKPNLNLLGTNL